MNFALCLGGSSCAVCACARGGRLLRFTPSAKVPAERACPAVDRWDGQDRRQVAWPANATNVWCAVPEYVERGETVRR